MTQIPESSREEGHKEPDKDESDPESQDQDE